MSRPVITSLAGGIGGSLTLLNGIAWMTTVGGVEPLSIVLALAPAAFGAWGYPFARRRGDSPSQAFHLACLYASALSFVLLALLAFVPRI